MPPLEERADRRVPSGVHRVPANGRRSERQPYGARGSAATYGGRAPQRRRAASSRSIQDGRVALANPRAEALLGAPLAPGESFAARAPAAIAGVVAAFSKFVAATRRSSSCRSTSSSFAARSRGWRAAGRSSPSTTSPRSRARSACSPGARWRARSRTRSRIRSRRFASACSISAARVPTQRVDFDRVLEQNVNQILAEIDRLDEIARAFSRYGAAPEERREPEPTDVASVVREVVSLERMGAAPRTASRGTRPASTSRCSRSRAPTS